MKPKGIQIGVNEIVEITFGALLNQSSISYFYRVCDRVDAVKKGDLFVATHKDKKQAQQDIEKALQQGAFGILFSGDVAISDSEVVWISVENLEQSLIRILRHYCIIYNKILFLFSKDEYEIATQIIEPKKTLGFYCGTLTGLINTILENNNYTHLVYCDSQLDLEFLPKNQQEIKVLSQEKISDNSLPFIVNSYSLFTIRIFYQSMDYEIALPRIFVQFLARVLKFCEEYSFGVQLGEFIGISNFKPIYLDERGVVAKPGTTNKVLITCMDAKLYEQYLAYFTMNAKWAHLVLFVPEIYQEIYTPCVKKVLSYSDNAGLFEELIQEKYNFALILGCPTYKIEERFTREPKEKTLFED